MTQVSRCSPLFSYQIDYRLHRILMDLYLIILDVPMPFLSTLIDRFTSAKAKGRSEFDWSAIGLGCAEDAGIDISEDVQRNRKLVEESKTQ